MSISQAIVIGNLGRNPELRTLPDGTPVANFSVATNRKVKGVPKTTWFDVSAYGRQAEIAMDYLAKGNPVYVQGDFDCETWQDRQGETRVTLKVRARDLQLIGGSKVENGPAGRRAAERRDPAPVPPVSGSDYVGEDLAADYANAHSNYEAQEMAGDFPF